jgi:hypothetical protein
MSAALSTITSADDVDRLAPLYRHLHEHQAGLAPRLGGTLPARSAAAAWARRRLHYLDWLGRDSGCALLATDAGGEAIGYVLASTRDLHRSRWKTRLEKVRCARPREQPHPGGSALATVLAWGTT